MGIDVNKLLRDIPHKQEPKDQIDSLLDEVFNEEAASVKFSKDNGQKKDINSSDRFGKMMYDGHEVEVYDEVDEDGNTYIKDNKGVMQVKASDLKPLPGILAEDTSRKLSLPGMQPHPKDTEIDQKELKKTGFWDTYLGDMLERMGAGASMFGGGVYSMADKLDKILKYTNPLISIPIHLQRLYDRAYHPEKEQKSWLQEQAENAYGYAQTLRNRSDRYKGKDYKELWKESDYKGMFGEVFLTASESFPQSLVAAMGGGAGLAVTGATTGAQRYDELDEMPQTKDLPEYSKVLNAVSYGIFEAMFEKLGDELVGASLKRIYKLNPPGKVEEAVRDELTAWMDKQFKRYGLLWMPVAEGVEEVATQIADNITDFGTGVTNEWNPTEGCWDSFIYGAAGGMQFSAIGAPGAVINWHNKTSAKRDYKKSKEEFRKTFENEEGVETFMEGLTFMSPAEQEATLGSMAREGTYTDEQLQAVATLAGHANQYRAYYKPEAKAREKEAWRETMIQTEVREFKNKIMPFVSEGGIVQEVYLDGNEDKVVYIVKGVVGVQEQNGKLSTDVSKCTPELYYQDGNGDMQVTTPEHISGVHGIYPVDELLGNYEQGIRKQYELLGKSEERISKDVPDFPMEKDTPAQSDSKFENGEHIEYMDEEGNITEGVIADAFSSPEYVFLENGSAVPKERVTVNKPIEKSDSPELPLSEKNTDNENVPSKEYVLEDGVTVTEQSNGTYVVNREFTKANLAKGEKFVERLNKDYEDEKLRFNLVELPKADPQNKFEKKRWGVIVTEEKRENVSPVRAAKPEKIVEDAANRPEEERPADQPEKEQDNMEVTGESSILPDVTEVPPKTVIPAETDLKAGKENKQEAPRGILKSQHRHVKEVYNIEDLRKGKLRSVKDADAPLMSYFELFMPDGNVVKGGDSFVGIGLTEENIDIDDVINNLYDVGYVENAGDENGEIREDVSMDHKDITEDQETRQIKRKKGKKHSEGKSENDVSAKKFGADNKVITSERYEELKRQWREKTRGQLNVGFDPDLLSIGVQMAMFHLEAGARKFKDFAKSITGDVGDTIIPYLKSIYEGARYAPGLEKVAKDMDSSEYIANFKVEDMFLRKDQKVLGDKVREEIEKRIIQLKLEISIRKNLIKRVGNDLSSVRVIESEIADRVAQIQIYQEKLEQEAGQKGKPLLFSGEETKDKVKQRTDNAEVRYPVKDYPTDGIDHEQPHVVIERQIQKDVKKFVRELQAYMGWEFDKTKSGKIEICYTNLAKIGGFASFILWKPDTDYGVYATINYDYKDVNYRPKERFLWRVTTKKDKFTGFVNQYHPTNVTIKELASIFEEAVNKYIERNSVTDNYLKTKDNVRENENRSLPDAGRSDVGELDDRANTARNVSNVPGGYPQGISDTKSRQRSGSEKAGDEQRRDSDRSNGNRDRHPAVSRKEDERTTLSPTDGGTNNGNRGVSERSTSVERNSRNYHIRDPANMVPRGEIARIKGNIAAIRLLKFLEKKGRPATNDEQNVLAKFCGWGGLAEVLNTEKYNIESWREKYKIYHEEIKELLTPEEFASAVNSTINAHYTSGEVVVALWQLAERLGFKGGKILEPAAGIGNFLGLIPEHLSAVSDIRAYELDDITGRLLSYLYPDANVKVAGYETSKDRDFSLIITNVPFGHSAPFDPVHKDLSKFSLHNYFIAKSITQLRPGGLGIFITSNTTLDGGISVQFREWVTKEGNADLLGAIRLPNNAFAANAGTEVTTDILVFRKRDSEYPSPFAQSFRNAIPYKEAVKKDGTPTTIFINEYYTRHPEMMLGEPVLAYTVNKGSLYTADDVTLIPHQGVVLATALQEAIGKFDKDLVNIKDTVSDEVVAAGKDDTEGTLILRDGELRIVENGELIVPGWINEYTTDTKRRKVSRKDIALQYLSIRSVVEDLVRAEVHDDANIEELRTKLNKEYEAFVNRYGRFSRNLKLRYLAESDVNYNTVIALERVETKFVQDENGNTRKEYYCTNTDIFSHRVSFPISEPEKASSLPDALNISLAYRGHIDLAYVADLTGVTEVEAKEKLLAEGLVYVNPSTGLLEDKDTYLSGAVRKKLAEAQAAADNDPEFEKNVKDLEAVIPDNLAPSQISFRLGSTFIPEKYVENFVDAKLGIKAKIKYESAINRWSVDIISGEKNPQNTTVYGTQRIEGIDLIVKGLNLQQPVIYDYHEEDGKKVQVKNLEATAEAQNKLTELADEFVNYIRDHDEFMTEIAHLYNEKYNGFVEKKYSEPPFKHFPGANPDVNLRSHQKKAVGRCLQDSTLLCHQVGTGKTYTLITAAMEMRRLKIARKPMLVVQNSTVEQFVASFKYLYPSAKILSPTKTQMDAKNRVRLLNLITYGDWDAIVIPQSFISKIPDNPERLKAYINEEINKLAGLLLSVDQEEEKSLYAQLNSQLRELVEKLEKMDEDGENTDEEVLAKPKKVKDKARKQLGIAKRINRQADRKVDNVRIFEETGIDALFVDEAHNYKRLGLVTKLANVRGIDTTGSQRSFSMYMKVRHIQEKTGGKNVVFATGTPISNTMAEAWTMMRYISPDILEQYGISLFDEFASTFGSVEPSLEFTSTGSFKIIDRFKSYVNVPEFLKAFRAKFDVVLTDDIPEFKSSNTIPKLKDGHFTQKIIPQSDALKAVMTDLKKRMKEWEDLPSREKKIHSAVPLLIFKDARQAAIDLRLLDPSFPDDPNSKTNAAVSEILRIYRETKDFKGTQLVFCDLYQSSANIPGVRFNLYREIKRKLVEGGVPENEVVVINDYPENRREMLFSQVQAGDVRVLIGGTEKMGIGVNVQDRLAALHHIDAPGRPMDFEQRNGRILRQGNMLVEMGIPVEILTYGVEKTMDATAYQRLAIKQAFINQLMKGEDVGREVGDAAAEDDVTDMTFEEMMATLSGSQYAILHTQRVYELKKLQMAKKNYDRRLIELNCELEDVQRIRNYYQKEEENLKKYKATIEKYFPQGKITSVKIGGKTYTEKIGEVINTALEVYVENCRKMFKRIPFEIYLNEHPVPAKITLIGYFAFSYVFCVSETDGTEAYISGANIHSGQGLIASINSDLRSTSVADRLEKFYNRKKHNEEKIPVLKEELKKPFAKAEMLTALEKEVEELAEKMQQEVIDNEEVTAENETIKEDSPEERSGEDARFREQQEKWRDSNRENIRKEIIRLQKELQITVEMVKDRTELPPEEQIKMQTDRRYPGIFIPKSGKAYLIMDEITDAEDLRKTVYHEYIGHRGLRGLLGNKLGQFCNEVLKSIEQDKRKALLMKYKGNRQLAAEEYLAGFAEGYREPTAWLKVKAIWNRMLRKVGISLKLNDTDLKYLLWKAKNRLKETDSPLDQLGKVVKDYTLYRESENNGWTRESVSELEIDDADKLRFHNEIASSKFQFTEAYQDRMLAVKRLQDLIELNIGKKLPDYMNAYMFENTLASRNKYEMEYFRNNYIRPLTKAIAELEKAGMSRREIENYVLLKHGLERNAYMRDKKIREALAPLLAELDEMKKDEDFMTEEDKEEYERILSEIEDMRNELINKLEKVDFAGVSVVSNEVEDEDAAGFIENVENSYPAAIDELWRTIKQATDFSLKKWYESGMMNRYTYGKVRKMFKWYVPLRGFEEVIADDVYEYFGEHDSIFTSPLRRMNGRRSRADNPFAYIASQAESAIVGGNKNLMKLHLFRLAQKYPSSFMSVSKVWYEQVGEDEEGKPVFEAAIPAYDEDTEVYRDNMDQFNLRMHKLETEGKAKRSFNGLKIGLRTLGNEASEHIVRVRQNGEEFAIFVHGDPRVAQAVNGLNDQERNNNKIIRAIQQMNRQLAANFTTRNPAFVASNLCRDLIFSVSALSVKESSRYRNSFVRNIPKASRAIMRYLCGKVDKGNEMDMLFQEFMEHGGETGYTALYHVEKYKQMIDAEVRNTRQGKVKKMVLSVLDFFEKGNRWAEDLSRFTTYVTSRQEGRSVLKSVADAKEVTVNFNRKGSGAKGAQTFKSLFLFFNAAVQSLANFNAMFKKNPTGATIMVASYGVIGFLMPMLLMGLGGDDALEEYLNLPDYIRKNNVCIYLGKNNGFVTIPLPIELRAFNGLGDAAFRYLSGEISGLTASGEVMTGFADLLPLNPAGGGTPFVPDAIKPVAESFYTNKDFTGRPIAKVTPYNRFEPEYRKVYRGTGEFFVKSSEVLNNAIGGDYATRGFVDKAGNVISDILSMDVNISNPASLEHLFEAYLGGMYTTFSQSLKLVGEGYKKVVTGEFHVEPRNIPIGNRFYYQGGIWGARSKINVRYFKALDDSREIEHRLRKYNEALHNGTMDIDKLLEKYSKLVSDGSYERIKVTKYYSKEVNKLNQALHNEVLTDDEGEELQAEILLLKEQMLQELQDIKSKEKVK